MVMMAVDFGGPTLEQSPSTCVQISSVISSSLTLNASPSYVYVGEEVTFFANASSDVPGATLNFTIFYDYYLTPPPYFVVNPYSPVTVNTTSSPGSVVTKYTYNTPGNWSQAGMFFFWVFLFVSDGYSNLSVSTQVFVNTNLPPDFISPPPDPLITAADELNYVSIMIFDFPYGEEVTVFWDFGDGTNATNVTFAPPTGVYVNQTHAWNPRIPGVGDYFKDYWLNVSLSDGTNPPTIYPANVNVSVPANKPPTLLVQASVAKLEPMQQVNFTVNASDPEGDPLTWTFNYSDGTIEVFNTDRTAPGELVWQNVTHSFASPGDYTVNVSVSDALIPNQVGYHNVTISTPISVVLNVPPSAATAITLDPSSPEINGTIGYVDLTCSLDAFDLDGENVTLIWSLDGTVMGTNVSAGGTEPATFYQVIRFTDTGTHNVSVTVSDGRPGHEVLRYRVFRVTSNNLPPDVLIFNHDPYVAGDFATPNETVKFRLVMTDPELNAIELVLDWGDGSPKLYMNLTVYQERNITLLLNHTYTEIGNYTVRINLTDNKVGLLNHTKSYTLPVRVYVRPSQEAFGWDWWDYTSLGLAIMIPVGMVLWYVELRIKRKRIEDQGMTYDEWKLRKEIESEETKGP
jgi:hypothetical protein